jgi:competence protein CoiA
MHRRSHFFHLNPSPNCRQNGKSLIHLQTQWHLQKMIPGSFLEKSFDAIQRIADVAWLEKSLIFEIQCSPISAEEVIARNRDYAREGFQVVWILHDRQFNKQRMSAAEWALLKHPHYFTNMNAEGKGWLYDQWSRVQYGKRFDKLPPLMIDPSHPRNPSDQNSSLFPVRKIHWKVSFSGDLFDCSEDYLEAIRQRELKLAGQRQTILAWLQSWIFRPYYLIFQLLLEKACR